MRSFVGTRVKIINEGRNQKGMVSSVKGDKIIINISATEIVEAPLDDAEITVACSEDEADFVIEW